MMKKLTDLIYDSVNDLNEQKAHDQRLKKSTDTVLLKGSRGLRMDRITAALEAEK